MYSICLILLIPASPLPSIVPIVADTVPSVAILTVRKHGLDKPTVAAGIVIADDIVLTCYHVIEGRAGITVEVGGNNLAGVLDWEDKNYDLATVRVKSPNRLKAVTLSERYAVHGEDVVAIGHPLGYLNSVSRGVVSGLNREVQLRGPLLKGLIQHSAAISRGNSGGPLLTVDGQVIGVTTAYNSEGNLIAFAIPSTTIIQRLGGRYVILRPLTPCKADTKPLVVRPMTFALPEPMGQVSE